MPFKSAFGCFKSVVVYLSCIWLFRCYLAFFKGWSGIFCLWLTGNPASSQCYPAYMASGLQSSVLPGAVYPFELSVQKENCNPESSY